MPRVKWDGLKETPVTTTSPPWLPVVGPGAMSGCVTSTSRALKSLPEFMGIMEKSAGAGARASGRLPPPVPAFAFICGETSHSLMRESCAWFS